MYYWHSGSHPLSPICFSRTHLEIPMYPTQALKTWLCWKALQTADFIFISPSMGHQRRFLVLQMNSL